MRLALLAALLVGAPAQAQELVPGMAWLPAEEETELADRALALLNRARDTAELPLLIGNPQLDLLAFQHSAEMARRGQVGHHSHWFGIGTGTRVRLAFPGVYQFSENVAMNSGAGSLHAALMASAGHRMNRMDPSFTHVGIGIARADRYRVYLTEIFVRVIDPRLIDSIEVLYTEAPPEALPRDEARHGEVVEETVSVPRPGDNDPEFWTQRGIDAYVAGRYQEAVRHFERALEIDPDYEFARYDLGRTLVAQGNGERALTILEIYLETHPEDLDAWADLGAAALLTQGYSRAEGAFRRVLRDRARNANAWYNLGLALEYQDRPNEAENAYAQAFFLDRTLVAAAVGLARVRR